MEAAACGRDHEVTQYEPLGRSRLPRTLRCSSWLGRQVSRTDTEGYFSLQGLVSGAPYVAWVRASDVHFGYWRMAFVANADDPVNLGVVMPEN